MILRCRTVSAMAKHTSEDKVQQHGLKMLSLITKYFPKQTLGESNLRAIITAMKNRPEDAITQLFGCAALRTISEQGKELQHCGEEARASTFAHLDAMLAALAHPRNATDTELQDCICSLIHSIIFSGGCEARMVARLQRESSPRTATTLEEWFLDTLLVQSNACAFREQILQPSQADAWLCCGGQDARSAGLEAFFSVEG